MVRPKWASVVCRARCAISSSAGAAAGDSKAATDGRSKRLRARADDASAAVQSRRARADASGQNIGFREERRQRAGGLGLSAHRAEAGDTGLPAGLDSGLE